MGYEVVFVSLEELRLDILSELVFPEYDSNVSNPLVVVLLTESSNEGVDLGNGVRVL